MSRIGKLPITVPAGVEVKISDTNEITVKGKNGTLSPAKSPSFMPDASMQTEPEQTGPMVRCVNVPFACIKEDSKRPVVNRK